MRRSLPVWIAGFRLRLTDIPPVISTRAEERLVLVRRWTWQEDRRFVKVGAGASVVGGLMVISTSSFHDTVPRENKDAIKLLFWAFIVGFSERFVRTRWGRVRAGRR